MTHIKRINELNSTDYSKEAQSIINWARKKGILIGEKHGEKRDYYDLGGIAELVVNFGANKTEIYPRGMLVASSGFDKEPLYVTIVDSFKNKPKNKELFDLLMETNLREATNGRNPQWGTWKFAIRSMNDVEQFKNCFEKIL